MKGILLAGGNGSRLSPMTLCVNKHLLPIYDKPLIYYPLATLMIANIRDILIIARHEDLPLYKKILSDGSQWGINISYLIQKKPNGIAESVIIGEEFIAQDSFSLILGDNIFFGHGLKGLLEQATKQKEGATIFSYWVQDPERFGVVEFDKDNKVIDLAEKPKSPKSNFAVTGLYFYDFHAVEYAKSLIPSARGELEITDLNRKYLENNSLHSIQLSRGFSWLDTGTTTSLLDAANYVAMVEKCQGLKIACLEEIAWRQNWIDDYQLNETMKIYKNSSYELYLKKMIECGK